MLLDENTKIVNNPYSWNLDYSLIFVDQPLGTGFTNVDSSSDIPRDQYGLASQFYNAFIQLYTNDQGCFKGKSIAQAPVYIFGESYAGKMVPSITRYIYEKNNNNPQIKINLKGAGIGDPFTDPHTLLSELPLFAFNMGLIDYQER